MATKRRKPAEAGDAPADSEKGKHKVLMTAGTVELPKQQAALSLEVHKPAGGKLGTLKVSRGSVSWKVGNQAEQRLSWEKFAALFKDKKEQKLAAAGKKVRKAAARKTAAAKTPAEPDKT